MESTELINYKKLASKRKSLIGLIESRLFEHGANNEISPYKSDEMMVEIDINTYNKYKNYSHKDTLMDSVVMIFASRGYTALWSADGIITISFDKQEAINTIVDNKWKTLSEIESLSPKELRSILRENFTCNASA